MKKGTGKLCILLKISWNTCARKSWNSTTPSDTPTPRSKILVLVSARNTRDQPEDIPSTFHFTWHVARVNLRDEGQLVSFSDWVEGVGG